MFSRLQGLTLAACFCLAMPFTLAEAPGQPPETEQVLERFKVARPEEGLVLPVRIQGKTYQFLLDTGATVSCYDSVLPVEGVLGESKANTGDGSVRVLVVKAPPGTLGKLPFGGRGPATSLDLTKIRQVSGLELYGVIGMDFLSRHVLQIDFDAEEVRILKSAARAPGARITLHYAVSRPSVTAQVPGFGQTQFLIDTGLIGMDSGSFRRDVYQTTEQEKKLKTVGTALAETASGTRKIRLGEIAEFSLDGFKHRDLLVSDGRINILSLSYFSRYLVTFDFPSGVVYLQKGKTYARPDARDLSGVHLLRTAGKTVVHSVDQGSPGERAGLKAADELVRVGGRQVEKMTLQSIRRLFGTESKGLPLVLRRGTQTHDGVLVLKNGR